MRPRRVDKPQEGKTPARIFRLRIHPPNPGSRPWAREKLTPSTALTTPRAVKKWVFRPWTWRIFIFVWSLAGHCFNLGLRDIPEPVAQEVNAEGDKHQGHPGEDRDPPVTAEQDLVIRC